MKLPFALLTGALALASCDLTGAAPGDVDPSFDAGSYINAEIHDLAVQTDGKALICGLFTTVHGALRRHIARLNLDGTVDRTFNVQLEPIDGDIWKMILLPDGKILIMGQFASIEGEPRNGLARLNPDGSLDRSFADGLAAIAPRSFGFLASVQPGGQVLLAGRPSDPTSGSYVVRLTADGVLDPSFQVLLTHINFDPGINCLAVQSDGKVLLAGSFETINGAVRTNFARLNADGTFDPTFTNALACTEEDVCSLMVLPSGKIMAGGYFQFPTRTNGYVFRLNSDGTTDTSFNCPGLNGMPYALGLQGDGRILITGSVPLGCARLNANGSLDSSFLSGISAAQGRVITTESDGKILLGGSFEYVNSVPHRWLARLNSDGSLEPGYPEGPTGPDSSVTGLAVQPDGRVLMAGPFNWFNGLMRYNLARVLPNGALDPSLTTVAMNSLDEVYVTLQPDGKFLFYSWDGLGRFNSDGSSAPGFLLGGQVAAVALQPDGKLFAAGRIPKVSYFQTTNLVRLNLDGTLDRSFSCAVGDAYSWLCALALQPDGKLIFAGDFLTVNGVSRPYLARVNPNGSLDSSFLRGLSGPNGIVSRLARQRDGRILFTGSFSTVNGAPCHGIGRLNSDGSLDTSFNATITNSIYSLLPQPDGKVLIGGWFTDLAGAGCTNLARLNPDGTPDPAFKASCEGYVLSLAFQPDGKLIVAGQFPSFNGTPCASIIRLMGEFQPPVVTAPPQSKTVEEGKTFSFAVRSYSYSPAVCQWFFNQTMLSGGTDDVYQVSAAKTSDAGLYSAVLSNIAGVVTSTPAMLQVVPPVARRPVPGLLLSGWTASPMQIEFVPDLAQMPHWLPLDQPMIQTVPQWYFDVAAPGDGARFYRAAQRAGSGPPGLSFQFVMGLTLTGTAGSSVRLDYINQVGPTDAWVPLATVTLTNTSQLYFDTSAGKPARIYRVVQLP